MYRWTPEILRFQSIPPFTVPLQPRKTIISFITINQINVSSIVLWIGHCQRCIEGPLNLRVHSHFIIVVYNLWATEVRSKILTPLETTMAGKGFGKNHFLQVEAFEILNPRDGYLNLFSGIIHHLDGYLNPSSGIKKPQEGYMNPSSRI